MSHFFSKILFIIGFIIGILLAVLLLKNNQQIKKNRPFSTYSHYINWFKKTNLIRKPLKFDEIRYGNQKYMLESDFLHKNITIFCLILVRNEKNLNAAKNTWAQSCTHLKAIPLNSTKRKTPMIKEKRTNSWVLLCNTLKNIPQVYDWILVVNDYTFVILENLRFFLAGLNQKNRYYLGHAIKLLGVEYNMGDAGYVLSKGTIETFQKSVETCSNIYFNKEDYELGRHLRTLNITVMDTSDPEGCNTFHPYNWYHILDPGDDYYITSVFPNKCCSRQSIAFQAIEADKMFFYYYVLYTLQIFNGGSLGNRRGPLKSVMDDNVWKDFLKSRNLPINVSAEQYYRIWENLVDDPVSFAKHIREENSESD